MRMLLLGTLLASAALLIACSAGVGGDSAADGQAVSPGGEQEGGHLAGETSAAGRAVFERAACIACHGQNGEGTEIAPALGGHSPEMIRSQVRNPVGAMPRFGPEQLSDSDLEALIEYIGSLESAHEHEFEATTPARAHFQMVINAIEQDDVGDATHHLQHAIEMIDNAEQKHELEKIIEILDTGDAHTAEHKLLEMAGDLADEEVPGQPTLHLQLALSAIRDGDADQIEHHLTHYTEISTGDELEHGEEALQHALNGDLHDAEDVVNELLGRGHDDG